MIAAATHPTQPTQAIFRVIAGVAGFEFARTLICGGDRTVERFGPYTTQRAAHELAQRAATRLLSQHPRCVVGVIDVRPEPSVPLSSFRADVPGVPQTETVPTCAHCGKPTGFYRGRPQLYCKKLPSQIRSPCAVAAKIERDLTDPARKAAHLARQRERYARLGAAPGGREAMREKDRQRYARLKATPEGREQLLRHWRNKARPTGPTIVCEGEPDGVVPTCAECGRPTGFYHGRPLRFCPRQAGEVRSRCQIRHTNQRAARAVRDNPELRLLRNQQQREYDLRHPEKRREKVRRDQERRRADPKRYAAKLAAERERKARVRAQARANRQAALPTGSVLLTASPRAPGRDLLVNLYAVVPSHLPPDLRMEIISETAVLVLEGVDLGTAVAQASKSVRKNAAPLRYTKPIEDCSWLADESSFAPEAHL